jgi:hypothetical protein
MPTSITPTTTRADPVEAARAAIWRLFVEHHIDENMATTCLLAIDLGLKRAERARQASNGQTGPTRRAA